MGFSFCFIYLLFLLDCFRLNEMKCLKGGEFVLYWNSLALFSNKGDLDIKR